MNSYQTNSYKTNSYRREQITPESWLDSFELPKHLTGEKEKFQKLWSVKPEKRGEVIIYGRKLEVPRWQKSYLRGYHFSGITHDSDPLPECFQEFLHWVKGLDLYNGKRFNQVLVNWYNNGMSYIGSHSDDESQLIPNSPIVSVSLGAERKFRIRSKETKKIVKDIILKNGQVVVMGGKFQQELKHEIVKVSGKKGEGVGPRINITCRQFK